jgi:hypothetical protein
MARELKPRSLGLGGARCRPLPRPIQVMSRNQHDVRLWILVRRLQKRTHRSRPASSFMISSAHRTASEIAATVAGTRLPPSYCASFRAARIATMMPITRLRDSSTY